MSNRVASRTLLAHVRKACATVSTVGSVSAPLAPTCRVGAVTWRTGAESHHYVGQRGRWQACGARCNVTLEAKRDVGTLAAH